MIFWTGIILALVVAVLTAKKGIYETWAFLFNLIIAVYLALTLGPVLNELLRIELPVREVFVIFGTAVVCLTVLYGISYVIFLSQFRVTFPKMLDFVGGAAMAFLAALLIWSFLAFLIWISPLSKTGLLAKIGLDRADFEPNIKYMKSWSKTIEAVVSPDQKKGTIDQIVDTFVKNANEAFKTPRKTAEPNEPKPPTPLEERIPTPADLGPPPELNSKDI